MSSVELNHGIHLAFLEFNIFHMEMSETNSIEVSTFYIFTDFK